MKDYQHIGIFSKFDFFKAGRGGGKHFFLYKSFHCLLENDSNYRRRYLNSKDMFLAWNDQVKCTCLI